MFFSRIGSTNQPNNNVYLMDIRVYIAGVLVPVLRVHIASAIEQPSEATFDMPPYPELMQVGRRDRVPVQIFYKDTLCGDDNMHLIFDGYISSVSYTSTAMSRAISFNAVSWLRVFGNFKFTETKNLNNVINSNVDKTNEQSAQINTALVPFEQQLIMRGLGKEQIKFPCEYLHNLFYIMDKLGEKNTDVTNNGYSMTSYATYYKQLSTRLKMCQRMCGTVPFDLDTGLTKISEEVNTTIKDGTNGMFPILEGLQRRLSLQIIERTMQDLQAQDYSVLGIINKLMASLDYEFLNIGTPAYHKERVPILDEGKGPEIATMCLKPNLANSPYVPQCNIIFRTQVVSIGTQEVFENVPTRVRMKNIQGALTTIAGDNIANPLNNTMLTAVWPTTSTTREDTMNEALGNKDLTDEEVEKKFSSGESSTSKNPGKNPLADDLLDTEKYTGPVIADFILPSWFDNYSGLAEKGAEKSQQVLHERFMRKQLLESIYNVRSLVVNCVFDPYVQPGFCAAVFDGGDTGMSFAGYVTSVTHDFAAGTASTSVTMAYARTLEEAASLEIPSAVEAIGRFTHNKEYFEDITYSILGDGYNTDKVKEEELPEDEDEEDESEDEEETEESDSGTITTPTGNVDSATTDSSSSKGTFSGIVDTVKSGFSSASNYVDSVISKASARKSIKSATAAASESKIDVTGGVDNASAKSSVTAATSAEGRTEAASKTATENLKSTDTESEKETVQIESNYGCRALHFKEIYKNYAPVETLDKTTNPQHSLPAAYTMQKRNIITFDQYLEFYDMVPDEKTAEYVTMPTGEKVLASYACDWISNRKAIDTHDALWAETTEELENDPASIIHFETVMHAKLIRTFKDDEDEEQEEEDKATEEAKDQEKKGETTSESLSEKSSEDTTEKESLSAVQYSFTGETKYKSLEEQVSDVVKEKVGMPTIATGATASLDTTTSANSDGSVITEGAQKAAADKTNEKAATGEDGDESDEENSEDTEEEEAPETEADLHKKYFDELQAGKTSNVRNLLRAIAKIEFSRTPYKEINSDYAESEEKVLAKANASTKTTVQEAAKEKTKTETDSSKDTKKTATTSNETIKIDVAFGY